MDSDRPPPPHRTTSFTADLFICFTSRLHSSSMKSILSPGRTAPRDPPISLSASLSRRLRTSRSIKGGASPAMFPTSGKKRGGGFENPEPSSPKVTCIGQVRVKSKKKNRKQLRTLSRRRSSGEVSFRKLERSGDGFGRSQNLGSNSFGSHHENLPEQRNNQRWVHLPLTICEALRAFGSEFSCLFPCRSSCFSPAKEEKPAAQVTRHGSRSGSASCAAVCTRWLVALHDGDGGRDIELVVSDHDGDGATDGEEDRSFRASRRHVFDDLEIVNDQIEGCKDESRVSICIPPKNALLLMRCRSDPLKMEALANRLWESTACENDEEDEEIEDHIKENTVDLKESEADEETNMKSKEENQEIQERKLEINEEDEEIMFLGWLFEEIEDQEQEIQENDEETMEEVEGVAESEERGNGVLEREGLPECLLLMMCEPKLSMEVSKETWVCSKDFIRRQSSRKKPPPPPPLPMPVKPTHGEDESKACPPPSTTTATTHVKAEGVILPGRSSCSLPAPPSMAEMLEQKLGNAVGYEPFVLTRCKSEPMRTAASKLAPETCFWKNRKVEPLRRASFGVGAAGLGF